METKKTNKKWLGVVIGLVILAALIGIFGFIYAKNRPQASAGSKSITIDVVDQNHSTTDYQLKTDAMYLRQAMEEADGLTFSGTESDYGMMVDTVNGIRADYEKDNAYWSFYVNDEYCNYGIDTQPVEDGDSFRIEYTSADAAQ